MQPQKMRRASVEWGYPRNLTKTEKTRTTKKEVLGSAEPVESQMQQKRIKNARQEKNIRFLAILEQKRGDGVFVTAKIDHTIPSMHETSRFPAATQLCNKPSANKQ
jgi:hypothetical protein